MNALTQSLLVFVGAGIGANARFWVGVWAAQRFGTELPYGTAIVNVSGSLLIGVVAGWLSGHANDSAWRPLLIVGVLGGYTTFSAFSMEMLNLIRDGRWIAAVAYSLGSVLIGLLVCAIGFWVAGGFRSTG